MACAQAIGARIAAPDDDHTFAGSENLDCRIDHVAMAALVLLRQEFHGKMNSLQLAAGNFEIARSFGAARQHNGIEVAAQIFDRDVAADFRIGDELYALGRHLFQATINDVFLELELWNSVAK